MTVYLRLHNCVIKFSTFNLISNLIIILSPLVQIFLILSFISFSLFKILGLQTLACKFNPIDKNKTNIINL